MRIKSKPTMIDSLYEKIGHQIYFGPFSGLTIPSELKSELTLAEVLGFYESCLFGVWESLAAKNIDQIMMVGGSHGYYSAGLSYLFQPKKTFVFESNIDSHDFIKKWVDYNDINMPELFETATTEIFSKWNTPVDLIISDCEGGEFDLLDPQKYPWQKACDLVIEVHPFYKKNLLGTLINRFKKTHKVNIIYDDFGEDQKIRQVLEGFGLEKFAYDKHPSHRWINKDGKKVYTSGVFLYLEK